MEATPTFGFQQCTKAAVNTVMKCYSETFVNIEKSTVFLFIQLCYSEKARRFGGTYRLHFQGRRVIQARNHQNQAASRASQSS
jgi:hypothetical protein